jgi:hypothetical protein
MKRDDLPGKGIILTGIPENGKATFFATAQQPPVDWGDGSETEIYTSVDRSIAHIYTDNTACTVQIREKGLTIFRHNRHSKGYITSMGIRRCAVLEYLSCDNNQLTSLNISGCAALRYLDCSGNQLTGSALNAIFSALPRRSRINVGCLKIYNNPDINNCDKTIAKNRGWWIDFTP